jgi:diguanylate cyclase (GGDEF)-like protein
VTRHHHNPQFRKFVQKGAKGFKPTADVSDMSLSALPTYADAAEDRSRVESVLIGIRVTVGAALVALAYAAATWQAPHRTAIVLLLAVAILWGVAVRLVGVERVVRSARSHAFLLVWSIGAIALIAALTVADGGVRSPLALLFFLPLAFVALSYPLPLVVAVGAVDVFAFAGIGVAVGGASRPYLGFYATCLGITAVLCACEARAHDRQRDALRRASRTDPLTGCLNRRGFEERVDAEVDAGRRSGRPFGLVLLDLDHFKAVNDTRGHAAGDDLLRWTLNRAGAVLRPMDAFGRIGGDEFAILVPGASLSDAREAADRVRAAVAPRVSISAGAASFPANGSDRDALFRAADDELYRAKHVRAGDAMITAKRLEPAAR